MDLNKLKVAIITDSMLAFGGSDRLMFSLLKLFSNATIFTSSFNKKEYKELTYNVKTSFLQKFKFLQRHFSFVLPLAFEQFDLKGYDLVISLTAGPAKGVITNIYQPHLCIVLTPPRNIWEREMNTRGSIFRHLYSFASKITTHFLRIWDINAIKRVDSILTISEYIKKKTNKIYRLDSEVIYPGVSSDCFVKPTKDQINNIKEKYNLPDNFLFTLSRLYDHKRIDWNIKACIKCKTHLYIVGSGPDIGFLKRVASESEYIHFLGSIPDNDCKVLYSLASAFVFCALEDFGYVTLEALAQGCPVIGLNDGGTAEIVENGISGMLVNDINELELAISQKVWKRYNPQDCIRRAHKFDERIFHTQITKYIQNIYEKKS